MRASQMMVDPPTPEDQESDRENENNEGSRVESRCRIEGHDSESYFSADFLAGATPA
jgi:hypothetical protein